MDPVLCQRRDTDTLLFRLADIHAHADVTFDLDSAIRMFEAAQASLEGASAGEKRHVVERAETLAAKSSHPETNAFFAPLIEALMDDADGDSS